MDKEITKKSRTEERKMSDDNKKKEKKPMTLHKKLAIVEVCLVLLGIGIFFIILAATGGNVGAVIAGVIVAAIFIAIAVVIARKNRFNCPKCGGILTSTGRYRETGDFAAHDDGYKTTVTERVEYEYKCSCGYTKTIAKKEKIASYR